MSDGRFDPASLRVPIVQAPLAGGASTPALAAAVAGAGALGFLAAGYKSAAAVATDIGQLRSLTDAPFGVNVFAPPAGGADVAGIERYAATLAPEAARYGTRVGVSRHDDDEFAPKLDLVVSKRVAIVSFTFGPPSPGVVEQLHAAGSAVWVTVTNPDDAAVADGVGADALVVQGFEAGGHRGSFVDGVGDEIGLVALLRLVAGETRLPLIAAGGIADGAGVAAALAAGATAAQIGSALMLTPEAGTSEPHRRALRESGATALTRAFSGRRARGIVNRFMREHDAQAPIAYPDVHHLTSPIRAAARERDDPEAINLWAGQAHALALELPAGELIAQFAGEARIAARALVQRLPPPPAIPSS